MNNSWKESHLDMDTKILKHLGGGSEYQMRCHFRESVSEKEQKIIQ